MLVNEIFFSIQGEGKYTGYPTVFLRLAGCNLRCKYCDTSYSYHEGIDLDVYEIFNKITAYGAKRVCITGGEPLIQDISEILGLLDDYYVSIETNGSIALDKYCLSEKHNYIMDVKTPSSGFSDSTNLDNFKFLKNRDEIKFVIGSKEDYEWSKVIIKEYYKSGRIIFSTIYGTLKYEDIVKWILNDGLDVRFQIQMHKIIWDINKRGV